MTVIKERRIPAPAADEEFSPEYLAVLVVCGGHVRDSDWALLPEAIAARRPPPDAAANDESVRPTP